MLTTGVVKVRFPFEIESGSVKEMNINQKL